MPSNGYPYPLRTVENLISYKTDAITADNINTQTFSTQTLAGTLYAGGTNNQIHYTDSLGSVAFTGPGTAGQVLTSNGVAAPTFQTAPIPINAPNISGGTAGQIPVQTAPGTTSFIPTAVSGYVLTANGVGSIPSFAPAASSSGALPKVTVLQAGTSFTSTVGCLRMKVEIYGASAGGSTGGTQLGSGCGGGSGGYCRGYFAPGTYAYAIGAAGSSSTGAGTTGGAGGTTSWSSGATLMSAPGGGVATSGNNFFGRGGLGTTTSGTGRAVGFTGGGGSVCVNNDVNCGNGGSGFGGGGPGGLKGSNLNGKSGLPWASAGSGSSGSSPSGSGIQGVIVVTEYF